jgi:hypothetical protein
MWDWIDAHQEIAWFIGLVWWATMLALVLPRKKGKDGRRNK